ncbi:hypothetical protein IWX90DRAFT_40385 [Phyllosticta citrichinensis]|uniref:Uncharacterized protein n=1 Tax=Phyllosticta citrichinensis TaxID=1130410 RepID=A0ABR1Y8H9_9PEZI
MDPPCELSAPCPKSMSTFPQSNQYKSPHGPPSLAKATAFFRPPDRRAMQNNKQTDLALDDEWVGVRLDGLEVEMQSLALQKGGAAVKSRFIEAHRAHLRDEVEYWEIQAMATTTADDKFSDAYSMWKIKAGELALFEVRYPPATDEGHKDCVDLTLRDSYWGRTFQHNPNFAMNDPFRPKRTRNPLAGMERAVSPKGTRKMEVPPPALERAMAGSRARRVERILPNRVSAQTEEKKDKEGCNPM